jgi:hypothetical protein
MNMGRTRIRPGRASLFGGIAVSLATFILWTAVAHEIDAVTVPVLLVGVLAALVIGGWIRLADL